MEEPIAAFLETMNEYGQDGVELLATDNPANDKDFFLKAIKSLQATQERLDRMAPPLPPAADAVPLCTVERTRFKICRTAADINSNIDAARNLVNGLAPSMRVMSLDAEWDTVKNDRGMIVAQGTVAIIQLSYKMDADGL